MDGFNTARTRRFGPAPPPPPAPTPAWAQRVRRASGSSTRSSSFSSADLVGFGILLPCTSYPMWSYPSYHFSGTSPMRLRWGQGLPRWHWGGLRHMVGSDKTLEQNKHQKEGQQPRRLTEPPWWQGMCTSLADSRNNFIQLFIYIYTLLYIIMTEQPPQKTGT